MGTGIRPMVAVTWMLLAMSMFVQYDSWLRTRQMLPGQVYELSYDDDSEEGYIEIGSHAHNTRTERPIFRRRYRFKPKLDPIVTSKEVNVERVLKRMANVKEGSTSFKQRQSPKLGTRITEEFRSFRKSSRWGRSVGQSLPSRRPRVKKTVLIWTPFFGSYMDWFDFYGWPSKQCARDCLFTIQKDHLETADALLINSRDLVKDSTRLPWIRKYNQFWIYHNAESTLNVELPLEQYGGVFNWTSTVRTDSDVPAFYGKTVKGSVKDNAQMILNAQFERKTLGVAWAASNCLSKNNREGYVRKLQQYIQVDVFGSCGTFECSGGWSKADACLMPYKFYLAFENSNCEDYVTEKLWRTYTTGSIPIVRSGANYSKLAPPGSYINTADFRSPRKLAAYLRKVASDKRLYMSYMKWHRTHTVQRHEGQYWCDLCDALHSRSGEHKVYTDLASWHQKDFCYKQYRFF